MASVGSGRARRAGAQERARARARRARGRGGPAGGHATAGGPRRHAGAAAGAAVARRVRESAPRRLRAPGRGARACVRRGARWRPGMLSLAHRRQGCPLPLPSPLPLASVARPNQRLWCLQPLRILCCRLGWCVVAGARAPRWWGAAAVAARRTSSGPLPSPAPARLFRASAPAIVVFAAFAHTLSPFGLVCSRGIARPALVGSCSRRRSPHFQRAIWAA